MAFVIISYRRSQVLIVLNFNDISNRLNLDFEFKISYNKYEENSPTAETL